VYAVLARDGGMLGQFCWSPRLASFSSFHHGCVSSTHCQQLNCSFRPLRAQRLFSLKKAFYKLGKTLPQIFPSADLMDVYPFVVLTITNVQEQNVE